MRGFLASDDVEMRTFFSPILLKVGIMSDAEEGLGVGREMDLVSAVEGGCVFHGIRSEY